MRRLKIFTWHVHGSYLWYLSQVPHDFYIPAKEGRPSAYRGRTSSHPFGDNVIEVPAENVKDLEFDCILFQAHENWLEHQYEVLSLAQRKLPRIFLEHSPPHPEENSDRHPIDDPETLLVHVTHYNRMTWDNGRTPTEVVEHGVIVPDGVASSYEYDRGLLVINNIMNRGRRMGSDLFLEARKHVPIDMVGMGWREAGGLGEVPHSELFRFHAKYRFHYSPVRHSGLALSLCEAMMIGQPIVGLATTELVTVVDNGVSGYIDTNHDKVIEFMKALLQSPELARKLGRRTREMALERFHIDRFKRDWSDVFAHVTETRSPLLRPRNRVLGAKNRVAIISEDASPLTHAGAVDSGGQNIYVAHVARGLAREGFQVDVFTRRDEVRTPKIRQWEDGVRVISIDAGPTRFIRKEELLPYTPQFTRELEAFCLNQAQAYDIVHANFWISGLVACELKRSLGLPFVITFHALGRVRRLHQGKADEFPDVRFDIEDQIAREADHIIAECPQDYEDLRSLYAADPARMTVVPCGYDPEEIFPVDRGAARRRLGLDPKARICLQLGRLVPRKGIDFTIRGFARALRKSELRAKLLIVGGESETPDPLLTPEIGRLQKVARDEGIDEHVIFIGRRERADLKDYYSAADIFLTTPWYEPFGFTPLEAMACGTPVIGTRVGGIKYSVLDGETGSLVEPNDCETLADRITELLLDDERRGRMSKNAVARVQRCFRWEAVSAEIGELYERVLRQKRESASLFTRATEIFGRP